MAYTCAISGEQSDGKHYILRTTEGEELVCPEALFHNGADRRMVSLLVELQAEVKRLREHVFGPDTPAEQQEEHVQADDVEHQAVGVLDDQAAAPGEVTGDGAAHD